MLCNIDLSYGLLLRIVSSRCFDNPNSGKGLIDGSYEILASYVYPQAYVFPDSKFFDKRSFLEYRSKPHYGRRCYGAVSDDFRKQISFKDSRMNGSYGLAFLVDNLV